MDDGGAGIGENIVPRGNASTLLKAVGEPFDLVVGAVGKRVGVGWAENETCRPGSAPVSKHRPYLAGASRGRKRWAQAFTELIPPAHFVKFDS